MENRWRKLAIFRLGRAKKDLEVAIKLLTGDELETAANRAYYSIFHALQAVLASEEKDFSKYSAVIAYFNQHYIKTKIFPLNLFKLISAAGEIREASDYGEFYFPSFDEVKEQVESAKLIFDLVEKYINNLGVE